MDLLTLLNAIDDTYSEPELEGLCARMGVDYRFLPGYAKRHKAMELVATMQRRDELPTLAMMVAAERPALAAALRPLISALEENLAWLEGENQPAEPAPRVNGTSSALHSNGANGSTPNGSSNHHGVNGSMNYNGVNGINNHNGVNGSANHNGLNGSNHHNGVNGGAGHEQLAATTKGFNAAEITEPAPADMTEAEPETAETTAPPNPYTPGRPVSIPVNFFGRAGETAQLKDAIATGRHMVVVGPHRIGKSSLLLHAAALPLTDSQILSAVVDLSQPNSFGAARVAHLAWEQWWSQVRPGGVPLIESPRVFDVLVRKLQGADYRLVLMLDNLEQLVWRPRSFDPGLLETLHSLAADGIITLIASSRLSMGELASAAAGKSAEPIAGLTRLLRPLDLALLDDDAALALATEPSRALGLRVPEGAGEHLLEIAGPHPFFLQLAGTYLYEGLARHSYDPGAIAERFAAAAEPFWQEMLDSQSPPAQTQLLAESFEPEGVVAGRQLRILANRGLLRADATGYRPFGSGFAGWLGRVRTAQRMAGL